MRSFRLNSISLLFLFFTVLFPLLGVSASTVTSKPKNPYPLPPAENNTSVLFEGYSKVLSGENRIGFIVYKYEVNTKLKKFYSTYFLKAGPPVDISESLHAEADFEMNPISYQYTSLTKNDSKIIDAKFLKGKMTATVQNGKKTQTIKKEIPQGVFLSTFLYYLILKSKQGLQPSLNFSFQAIAEEDATIASGEAAIGKLESWKGFEVYKVKQKFKGLEYFSYIDKQGEVLSTFTPAIGISTEIVADANTAMAGFGGESNLKALFGEVPKGLENAMARKLSSGTDIENSENSKLRESNSNSGGIVLKSEINEKQEK